MMHRFVKDLRGDAVICRDGEAGSLRDAYFDDEDWALRYFVVDTGRWLPGRKALVPPQAVAQAGDRVMRVELSREEIERAPGIDADPPVSRLLEQARTHRYRSTYLWGALPAPPPSAAELLDDPAERAAARAAEERAANTHLRSGAEVVGYRIRAADGALGHVEDFFIDDADWSICAMIVDTRDWLPGRKVMVPPSAIEAIDWESGAVRVRLRRDELKRAPKASARAAQRRQKLKVGAAMTRNVRVAAPDETICAAAKAMAELDAGVLPVGEGERLTGMITDRDIAVRAVAERKGPDTPIREVMTNEVKYCYEDDELDHVASSMAEMRVRRMPVLARDQRLVGIVSLGDIAQARGSGPAGKAVAGVSRPGGPHSQTRQG